MSAPSRRLRIAVDIGGTFTDLAAFDETGATLTFGKALSTHDALVEGIRDALNVSASKVEDAYLFLHATTIGINTLLERTGAQTALLITTADLDPKWGNGPIRPDQIVEEVYADMRRRQ